MNKPKRNHPIQIRATSQERQAWADMVRADGQTLSEVVRDYLNKRLRRVERRDKEDAA
jgi:hypothetical protein